MINWADFKRAGARRLGQFLKPAFRHSSRGRLPKKEGRLTLPGLAAPVTIHRDRWGVPHIYAAGRSDLLFAQGFLHGQDRLWQLEINRRAATGRLAQLLGPLGLSTDRLTRTLGFARLAETSWPRLSDQAQADLTAYTAGINAFLALETALPLELSLLRHRPAPWQVHESVAFGRLQLWALSYGWSGELARAELLQAVGADLAAELEPEYPERNPITLPHGIDIKQLAAAEVWGAAAGPFMGRGAEGGGRGSNAWVISGDRSSTGRPILANDMHLPVTTPSLWYYNHLKSDDGFHVTGASQPGLPYVLVGHNEHIAWGATLAFADVEDLFIERLHPDRPDRYQFGSEWRSLLVRDENIAIRGQPDHVERVRATHHGPIISAILTDGPTDVLALASTALEPGITFDGFGRLNDARDWNDFVAAVARIEAPPLNLLYADTTGNIGHYVSGRVPRRAAGQGLTPAPGYAGTHEWTGIIPFSEMPHQLNPSRGYIVSANHRLVGDDYPHYLGSTWVNGYRARRLEALIGGQARISPADCRTWQMDVLNVPAVKFVAQLTDVEPSEDDAAQALALLLAWDGRMTPESAAAAVYKVCVTRLAHIILGRHLAPATLARFLGEGENEVLAPINEFHGYWPVTLMCLLGNPSSGWLPGRFGRTAMLNRALAETTRQLRRQLGVEPRDWTWGRLHQVRFPHVLGRLPLLAPIFDQGPHPIGGDTHTVLQTAVRPVEPYENNAFSVSYRQVIDLGHLDESQAMFTPGQSGQLASEHYGDLVPSWLDGHYFHMIWTQATVNANARATLELIPINSNR